MLNLTYQDHFNFGRNPEDENEFIVAFGPAQRPSSSPLTESVKAAELIYDLSAQKNITVLLSGGIDSECMVQAFLAAKIPFQSIFMRFKNGLNDFDIKTNVEFCEQRKIKYSFVDLDIFDFLESGKFLEVAKKYECQSPQLASHLWLLDQVDGVPVMGGNPIAPIWKQNHWYYMGAPGELHCTYFKYFLENERPGIPFFFMYTPELISSFFKTPVMKPYLEKNMVFESDYTYDHKCRSYIEGGFAVKPRVNKFTGFEMVRKHYDVIYQTDHGISFNRLFRDPLEKMFPFPESYRQLVPKNYFTVNP